MLFKRYKPYKRIEVLIIVGVLLIIGLISLWLSYDLFTSTPWKVQYAWRYTDTTIAENFSSQEMIRDWLPPSISGGWIEAFRLMLISGIVFSILGIHFLPQLNELMTCSRTGNKLKYESKLRRLLFIPIMISLIFVVLYHLAIGPHFLSNKNEPANEWVQPHRPWHDIEWCKMHGEDVYEQKPEGEIARSWYYYPYLAYLPHSLINFTAFPWIIAFVIFLGMRKDNVFAAVSESRPNTVLAKVAERYLFCVVSILSLGLFEFWIGAKTMSVPGILWTVFVSTIVMIVVVLFLRLFTEYQTGHIRENKSWSFQDFLKSVIAPSPWGFLVLLLLGLMFGIKLLPF